MAIQGFLKEIIEIKKQDINKALSKEPLNKVRYEAELRPVEADFKRALENNSYTHAGIIAEIKKASPSKGLISADLDVASYAEKYTEAGASAISVLTEEHFFKGSLKDLEIVRENSNLPILRKDFTISSYQIYEARARGANSILLITSILGKDQLNDYISLAREINLEPLVEIHTEDELEKADFCKAKIIGINNRNLSTLETDLNVSKRIAPLFLDYHIPIEASGISKNEDIRHGFDFGIFNFLVGESIIRADNTIEFIKELIYPE
ncbi:MAG: indole-3-glycerol phosphate synthase TrpC [Desulfobacteraceae bacterium]|nr:indole-3-glycerol phosphate synthase TrpC [Desulfobacteraceae bacterium]